MHEGPVAALPAQQQPNRRIHPQAVGVSLSDLQGQVPLLTQSSSSELRTMSEPVPLLQSAADPVVSHAQRWKEQEMDISSSCDTTENVSKQNGHCECSQSSDVAPGTSVDVEGSDLEAEYLKHAGDMSPQQQEGGPTETLLSDELHHSPSPALDKSSCNDPPASVNASEDCPLDLLRIVKHKPSAIVFCGDYDCGTDSMAAVTNESSDGGESSLSTTEEGEGDDDEEEEEDDVPEALQYKEFLVSRRRRNLSRNRKCLRKRQDAQPSSAAAGWQKPTNRGKPEFTGSREEEDTRQNNGEQVRQTGQERSDNKE